MATGHGRSSRCPPDELHDLPVLIFGIVLNRSGWRIDYFGASTPVDELVRVVGRSWNWSSWPPPRIDFDPILGELPDSPQSHARSPEPRDAAHRRRDRCPTSRRRPCFRGRAPRAPLVTAPHLAHRLHGHVRTATCSSP